MNTNLYLRVPAWSYVLVFGLLAFCGGYTAAASITAMKVITLSGLVGMCAVLMAALLPTTFMQFSTKPHCDCGCKERKKVKSV
jgi:hypothetical protein